MTQSEPRTPARPVKQPPWPLIVGVGVAALLAGVVLALVLGDGPTGVGQASATPSVSADGTDPDASASSSPTATAEPTATPAALIENRAVAEVATDGLEVRSSAGDAGEVISTLPAGRRLFVIGEPTETDGTRWYRVAPFILDSCLPDCGALGYVATPATEDDPATITEATVDCPASPMTEEELGGLNRLEALHCFGRTAIVVTGTVETPCCSNVGPITITPEWLGMPGPVFLRAGQGLGDFRTSPDTGLTPPERGDVVRVTGHFEDPFAPTCRPEINEDFVAENPGEVDLPSAAQVVLDCRSTFIWDDFDVTDHVDLGPCCGSRGGSTSTPGRRDGAIPADRPLAVRIGS